MVFPVFSYGTAVGWLSPMAPRLMSRLTPASAPVHQDVISWMASAPYLVGTPAVFLFGYIVDNCGRKKALLFTSLTMAVSKKKIDEKGGYYQCGMKWRTCLALKGRLRGNVFEFNLFIYLAFVYVTTHKVAV